jgi:hypothetical protein
MTGDELLQNIVGVTLALDALDLERFPQIAAQGRCHFDSHRLALPFLLWLHKAIRTTLELYPSRGTSVYFLTLEHFFEIESDIFAKPMGWNFALA